MRFSSIVAALVATVAAQNPFSFPVNGQTINAGDTVNLRWAPSTPGTVSLVVRNGNPSDLNPGTTIASGIPNSGSYSWNVDSSLVQGSGYTIQIISDSNENIYNFTPTFTINSDVTASSASASASMSMTSMASASMSSASMSASMSSRMSMDSMSSMMTITNSGMSTMNTASATMIDDAASSTVAAAAGTITSDSNSANVMGSKSGFGLLAALVGAIAVL